MIPSYVYCLSLLDVYVASVTCLAALYDLVWPPFQSEDTRGCHCSFMSRLLHHSSQSQMQAHSHVDACLIPDALLYWQAIKEEYEVVVCDTSGRLHTNASLMEELAKCKRAIGKRLANAPHETLLVLDGTTGDLHHCLLCRV